MRVLKNKTKTSTTNKYDTILFKMVHICVIGAGTAGLCAAKTAHEQGCQVTVFEQAKQVGGTW